MDNKNLGNFLGAIGNHLAIPQTSVSHASTISCEFAALMENKLAHALMRRDKLSSDHSAAKVPSA